MADTQVDIRPPNASTDVPRIWHLVCCRDYDGRVALCGEDVSEEPWTSRDDEVVCVMCDHADRRSFCPYYGRCLDDRT